jgi:hypothetical protein
VSEKKKYRKLEVLMEKMNMTGSQYIFAKWGSSNTVPHI